MKDPKHCIPKAIGIGIVCGLEPEVRSDCAVTLSGGCGITSHGHVISFSTTRFKYYRPYTRPVRGLVPPGRDAEVWELLPGMEQEDDQPLSPQDIQTERFIDDKVLFLYLEDEAACTVKPLVIDKDTLWQLLRPRYGDDPTCLLHRPSEEEDVDLFDFGEEEVFSGQRYFFQVNRNTGLSRIEVMRFGYAGLVKECQPEDQFFSIAGVIPEGENEADLWLSVAGEFKILIETLILHLEDCIKALHSELFHDLLPRPQREFLEAYLKFLILQRWPKFYRQAPTAYQMQYFWDFVRDLAATFNELIGELCRLMAECGQQRDLFPFHLLLGELTEEVTFGPSVFRTHFRQPPIYNGNAHRREKIRFLHWRMTMMIKCFYIPGVEPSDIADDHYAQVKLEKHTGLSEDLPELQGVIKITPARAYGLPLDDGTIPFYYYTARDPNSIIYFWSYETVRCGTMDRLFSYHSNEGDRYTTWCSIKQAFSYELRPYPFYRIEGHIGDSVNDALVRLMELRRDYHLEFEVLPVALDELLYRIQEDPLLYSIVPVFSGAEHLAGVERGGTFLLVYENTVDEQNCLISSPVRLDLSLEAACCVYFKQHAWYYNRQVVKGKLEYKTPSGQVTRAPGKQIAVSFRRPAYSNASRHGVNRYWNTISDSNGNFCFALQPNYHGLNFNSQWGTVYNGANGLYGSLLGGNFSPYSFYVTDPTVTFIPNQVMVVRYIDANGTLYRQNKNGELEPEPDNLMCLSLTVFDPPLFTDDADPCHGLLINSGLGLSYGETKACIDAYTERFREHRYAINGAFVGYKVEQAGKTEPQVQAYEMTVPGLEREMAQLTYAAYDRQRFNFTDQFCALFDKIVDWVAPLSCDQIDIPYFPGDKGNIGVLEDPQDGGFRCTNRLQYKLLEELIMSYLSRAGLQSLDKTVKQLAPEVVLRIISLKLGELPPGWTDFDGKGVFARWKQRLQGCTNPAYLKGGLKLEPATISSAEEARNSLTVIYRGLTDKGYYGLLFSAYGAVRQGYLTPTQNSRQSFTYQTAANGFRTDDLNIIGSWNCIFLTAKRATRLIERLDQLVQSGKLTEEQVVQFKSEAYFLRALAHFDALRLWGYFWVGSSEFGIPLYTTLNDLNQTELPRATVSEGYEHVLNDLNMALETARSFAQIEETNDSRAIATSTVSREAIQALLARVYLYRGVAADSNSDLVSAIAIVDEVINAGTFSLLPTYAEVFTQGRNASEVIFTAYADQLLENTMEYYYRPPAIGGIYEYAPTNLWKSVYEDGDNRLSANYSKENDYVSKYSAKIEPNSPVYLFRLAELYYIKAEAAFRIGNIEVALDLVNQFRKRAGIDSFSNLDLSLLFQERVRELSFEGSHEWFDAIRLDTLEVQLETPDRYVLPIPQRIIDCKNGLVQNRYYDPPEEKSFSGKVIPVEELSSSVVAAAAPTQDLSLLFGIGGKTAEVLHGAGISNFQQLATTTPERLRGILTVAGTGFANRDPSHWPDQARLAANEQWDELKALEERIRNPNP